jgi:serine protease Do
MRRTGAACGVLALVIAVAAAGSAPAAGNGWTEEEARILRQAELMSRASSLVAERLRQSVVNITAERLVGRHGASSHPLSPLKEDFIERFLPGRPQPRQRAVADVGSGVIVDAEGTILTNHHVVAGAESIMVKLADGREVAGELIDSSVESDIAVIQIKADNLVPAPLGDSDECAIGEFVLAIGNPLGFEATVTSGIVSARGRSGLRILKYEDFIQTDAPLNPGNSGGPLVNLRGEVIGINTAMARKEGTGAQGINFAIPINIARAVMTSILQNRKVMTSYLGVTMDDLTPEIASAFGYDSTHGALVSSVIRGSPAHRAGFRRGDIILRYGKRDITDKRMLQNLIALTSPGEMMEVTILREGRERALEVRLEEPPEEVVLERLTRQTRRILDALGIRVAELTPALRERLGYGQDIRGVLVTEVERSSAALRTGLHPGSVILAVNGETVATPEDLLRVAGDADVGKGVRIVWRHGRNVMRASYRFSTKP